MPNNKWTIEYYEWGQIGRLNEQFRDGDKLKYTDEDYWPFGIFICDGEEKISEDYQLIKKEAYKNLAKIKDFEFKYWEFRKNCCSTKPHESKLQRNAMEYNFIIEGKIRGRVDKEKDIILKAGDYIIIRPGFVINLEQEIIKDTKGITIKTPSIKGDTIKKKKFDDC